LGQCSTRHRANGERRAELADERARLVARRQIADDTFELSFRSPRIAASARPGQFVNVLLPSEGFRYRVFEDADAWRAAPQPTRPTLLRRPFSVYRAYSTDGGSLDTIDLLVKVVGVGSRQLCELSLGAEVQLLGPLGNGFELPRAGAPAALVAGGCGWASLGLLARELRRRGHPTYAFIGAETVEALPVETSEGAPPHTFLEDLPEACVTSRELEELGVVVVLAAEAGGQVYGGVVTDLLERFLRSGGAERVARKRLQESFVRSTRRATRQKIPGVFSAVHVYACGPWGMVRRVAELARQHGAPCQVALEELMACGVGVCNSCVVEVILPDGSIGHKRLCVEGPVLSADEVNWEQGRS